MAIYRVFSDADGESHIEDLNLAEHPELGVLINVSEVRVLEFDGSRNMDFHPLPERRLIVHLSGEVEIGASDGAKTGGAGRGYPADGGRHRQRPHPHGPHSISRGLRPAERLINQAARHHPGRCVGIRASGPSCPSLLRFR